MNDHHYLKTWNDYQPAWVPIDEARRRELLAADGGDAVKGISYARFGADGRIVQATGFFKVAG